MTSGKGVDRLRKYRQLTPDVYKRQVHSLVDVFFRRALTAAYSSRHQRWAKDQRLTPVSLLAGDADVAGLFFSLHHPLGQIPLPGKIAPQHHFLPIQKPGGHLFDGLGIQDRKPLSGGPGVHGKKSPAIGGGGEDGLGAQYLPGPQSDAVAAADVPGQQRDGIASPFIAAEHRRVPGLVLHKAVSYTHLDRGFFAKASSPGWVLSQ